MVAAVVAALAPNFAPTWWLGFGANMVWMLAVAYVLWRLPLPAWTGYPEVADAAPVGERVAAH